jgi:hypothetical protein
VFTIRIYRAREGTFEEGSKDCWVTKVASAYSASSRSVSFMNSGHLIVTVIGITVVMGVNMLVGGEYI